MDSHISVYVFPLEQDAIQQVFLYRITDTDHASGRLSTVRTLVLSMKPGHDALPMEHMLTFAVKFDCILFDCEEADTTDEFW